jgi:very-short-patch-repair endonuclease
MRREVPAKIKIHASANRKKMPEVEVLLWTRFRKWRADGIVIRRQHSISSYIVDFACIAVKLLIELDGCSHEGQEEYDEARQKWLEDQGWTVMRFSNFEVTENPTDVAERVRSRILYRMGESEAFPGDTPSAE